MKEIEVFSVDYSDEMGKSHLGLFADVEVANHVSKGN